MSKITRALWYPHCIVCPVSMTKFRNKKAWVRPHKPSIWESMFSKKKKTDPGRSQSMDIIGGSRESLIPGPSGASPGGFRNQNPTMNGFGGQRNGTPVERLRENVDEPQIFGNGGGGGDEGGFGGQLDFGIGRRGGRGGRRGRGGGRDGFGGPPDFGGGGNEDEFNGAQDFDGSRGIGNYEEPRGFRGGRSRGGFEEAREFGGDRSGGGFDEARGFGDGRGGGGLDEPQDFDGEVDRGRYDGSLENRGGGNESFTGSQNFVAGRGNGMFNSEDPGLGGPGDEPWAPAMDSFVPDMNLPGVSLDNSPRGIGSDNNFSAPPGAFQNPVFDHNLDGAENNPGGFQRTLGNFPSVSRFEEDGHLGRHKVPKRTSGPTNMDGQTAYGDQMRGAQSPQRYPPGREVTAHANESSKNGQDHGNYGKGKHPWAGSEETIRNNRTRRE
ncbi:hypothetical protein BS50DRAFT_35944 [Corynespora cassiicola Philippines]|uniref:Uncharacterized protein n=1 Tax=Corynespora cassiicola Philippines TaxID=1448308 RepID=A0A2T2PC39_CORCC|nr:hypothetical protein BS50DRAFT_35944 [Corynespora cassiicola Philippines]